MSALDDCFRDQPRSRQLFDALREQIEAIGPAEMVMTKAQRKGLPQVNCYDYALRRAAGRRGSMLAFGTTSGNLYLSEDDGENWEYPGMNSPLFYSVRFA